MSLGYVVIGSTVVRIVGTYDSPEGAAAAAAHLNAPDLPALFDRETGNPFRVDL